MVLLTLDGEDKQFRVEVAGKVIKLLSIKGLYNTTLSFADYVEDILVEARSEERRLLLARQARWRKASTM